MSSAAKNSDTAAAAASGGTATAHGEEEEETHDKLMLFINTLDYLKVYLAEEGLDKPPKILDILRVRVMRNACIRDDDDYIHWRNRVFLPPPPSPFWAGANSRSPSALLSSYSYQQSCSPIKTSGRRRSRWEEEKK